MSNLSQCDLNERDDLLKVQVMYPNPKCKSQKENNFTPYQFQLERVGFKSVMKKDIQRDCKNVESFHYTWMENS